jgi:hypothetical protein
MTKFFETFEVSLHKRYLFIISALFCSILFLHTYIIKFILTTFWTVFINLNLTGHQVLSIFFYYVANFLFFHFLLTNNTFHCFFENHSKGFVDTLVFICLRWSFLIKQFVICSVGQSFIRGNLSLIFEIGFISN